jgi:hypothetical protein
MRTEVSIRSADDTPGSSGEEPDVADGNGGAGHFADARLLELMDPANTTKAYGGTAEPAVAVMWRPVAMAPQAAMPSHSW